MGELTEQEINNMELMINTMARKVIGGKTPIEIYTREPVALIA
ncbi:hypothetical protein CI610_03471 [invertebrate metagenome]|uniref:Uncharacterized protein n=1 Tax=invertebrate metagenome TaxID=1711999 RepID=A0A2H9T330_9ZZZZ